MYKIQGGSVKKLFIAFLFTIISSSHAGFLVEPYLNYSFGSGDYKSEGSTYDISTTGPNFGSRLGFQYLGLMAGMDFNLGSFGWDEKNNGTTTKYDLDTKRFGIFAGYDFPILLRAWVGYFFKNSAEFTKSYEDGTNKGDLYNGSAIELGVGFTPLPLLSVNLGYRMNTYDEYEQTDGTKTALNGDSEVSVNEIFVGVSLPLDL